MIVRGKKEYLYTSDLLWMVLRTVFPLVLAFVGISNVDGISTRLFTILCITTAMVFAHLCFRDSQPKSEIIAFTEPVSLS
jgi:hypothetical protein